LASGCSSNVAKKIFGRLAPELRLRELKSKGVPFLTNN
jgi:hypothetical protein